MKTLSAEAEETPRIGRNEDVFTQKDFYRSLVSEMKSSSFRWRLNETLPKGGLKDFFKKKII